MGKFLLDTNVISELVRPQPDKNLLAWLSQQQEKHLYISVITLAEIMRGVSKLDDGNKKSQLLNWMKKDVAKRFSGRILDFDETCAFLWGKWQGEGDQQGIAYPVMDTQIAAIAFRFELTLVTRNTIDFEKLPIKYINPWKPL
ncbi:MAG: type II toxin-antitoxin system VapC family toxin [Cellvibrionaceae bacterium]|nr:type II toxin-antitoxin system VapC family toxin [Cellvibrionaceae bacterium]